LLVHTAVPIATACVGNNGFIWPAKWLRRNQEFVQVEDF